MKVLDLDEAMQHDLAAVIAHHAETDPSACYVCGKCSAGCPVASDMDYQPHQLMHLIHLGCKEEILKSRTIWLCASCITCSTRCPHDVDLARIMDVLREMARREGIHPGRPGVVAFNKSFLSTLRSGGRLHEFGMTMAYKLRTGDLLGDLQMGIRMFLRGKLKLLPARPAARKHVAAIMRKVEHLETGDFPAGGAPGVDAR